MRLARTSAGKKKQALRRSRRAHGDDEACSLKPSQGVRRNLSVRCCRRAAISVPRSEGGQSPVSIVLSENFRALFYAPFYAALATGAFRDAGVEVTLRPSPDPSAAARALRTGEADVMWGGPLRVMIVHDSEPDADLVCFADVVARDPFFVIGARPRPDFRLADLAKLKFASVSEVPTPWICLADDLRRAGVDPDRLDRICGPSMAENAAALRMGKLDAVQLFQPYAEELIASGAGHVWYAAASRGLTAYTTLVTRRADARRAAPTSFWP